MRFNSPQPSSTHTTQGRILNPKLGTIDEFENGRHVRRLYFDVKRGQPDTGKVVRIEQDGGILTEYGYNKLGAVSVYRKSQGSNTEEIRFTYDETGRHASVVGPTPR